MKMIILVLCTVVIVSCVQRKDESTTQVTEKLRPKMSKSFQKELDKLIESINKDQAEDVANPTVIVVVIDSVQSECVLSMAPSLYYFKGKLRGYFKYRDYLIAFYRAQSYCSNSVIRFEELRHDQPYGYPNEDSNLETSITYDPWGRKYKVLNGGELEMTYEGYF